MWQKHPALDLPTTHGVFTVIGYTVDGLTHLALLCNPAGFPPQPLLRIHSSCCFGDVFQTTLCDCAFQLERALDLIQAEGAGLVIYCDHEGRGMGLARKLAAIHLEQTQHYDTVEAFAALGFPPDAREYTAATRILHDLGITDVRLLTNNPRKIQALREAGIGVAAVPLIITATAESQAYVATKRDKLGHLFPPSEA